MLDDNKGILGAVVIIFLVCATTFSLTCLLVRAEERQKAVDAGVGYWEVDKRSGKTEFKYGVKKE